MDDKKEVNFAAAARKVNYTSPLTIRREKTTTGKVADKYPDGIHINGIDYFYAPDKQTGELGPRAVVIFTEDNSRWFWGSQVLIAYAQQWFEDCGGSFKKVQAALQKKPVHVILWQTKNGGHNYINAYVEEDDEDVSGE